MDDHLGSAKIFEDIFQFLYKTYFFYILFRPVYFTRKKTFVFDNKLDILGFEGISERLRPLPKHRDKVKTWSIPKNRKELDIFL